MPLAGQLLILATPPKVCQPTETNPENRSSKSEIGEAKNGWRKPESITP
jgi:hypothetical protein